MRLLVTGDREWDDWEIIHDAIISVTPDVIIHGKARGADSIADDVANLHGIPVEPYPAYWDCRIYEQDTGQSCRLPDGRHQAMHGPPAGPIRNRRMLDEGKPDLVFAFHDNLKESKGTRDMVTISKKIGLPVRHFTKENQLGIML